MELFKTLNNPQIRSFDPESEIGKELSDLPDGPWNAEPDRIDWVDEATNLDCMVQRNYMGNWCGYVAVESDHELYGQDYDTPDVDVHGGLTYSAACFGEPGVMPNICHIPREGREDEVWWFGFDTAHAFDLIPRSVMLDRTLFKDKPPRKVLSEDGRTYSRIGDSGWEDVYRDIDYVVAETTKLAKQLKELD